MTLLEIKDLHVEVSGHKILKGVTLCIGAGEVHAIMGPNGSGKSTLAQVLAGHPGYQITSGDILYKGESLLAFAPEERACRGIFLGFQYPVEIPGVNNTYFLRQALNAQRRFRGEKPVEALDFLKLMKSTMQDLKMDKRYQERALNEGFSGGEKKRNEILQMSILQPELAILDEIDSGLDIDALKIVAQGVNALRNPKRAVIMVTHYQRLLSQIVPDRVHVLANGVVVRSGGRQLALELEDTGYEKQQPSSTASRSADGIASGGC